MFQNFLKNSHKIILFDGVCNLCNSSVQRIIQFDKKDVFVFASLQSDIGKKILEHFQINSNQMDSIILIESEDSYATKSDAILKIAANFYGAWKLVQIGWIFPRFLRNSMYTYIAKNRYRWFGKKDQCMIPTKELRAKFID